MIADTSLRLFPFDARGGACVWCVRPWSRIDCAWGLAAYAYGPPVRWPCGAYGSILGLSIFFFGLNRWALFAGVDPCRTGFARSAVAASRRSVPCGMALRVSRQTRSRE